MSPRVFVIVCIAATLASVCESGQGDELVVSPEKVAYFENHVRPLLVERCHECHDENVQESNLRLDSLQAMIDGGQRGPAIVPGDAQKSLLVHAVNHSEAELQMPEGEKLAAHEIKYLAKWIEDGAIWPGQAAEMRSVESTEGPLFKAEATQFWAFRPPTLPDIPEVKNQSWPQSELDHFILFQLEQHGLSPAAAASKRSLLRRAYFDLIGLPPTPEQVRDFLEDSSPQAFERVIDRLLALPQYGERWGRHWLDVARYADSNGLDENWAFEFIYKYRDWVIDAFNNDLSYDQFIVHQIAGDLMPGSADDTLQSRMRRVAAAGFLSVGPKMIADDDPKKKKMDIIDEQLNTLSQTFMALTVGCARCHDHKFDPIPTWDYYAMASIFKSTRTMEHLRVVAPVWLHQFKPAGYDAAFAAYETQLALLESERKDFWLSVTSSEAEIDHDQFQLPDDADERVPEERRSQWEALKAAIVDHEKNKPETIKVMAPTDGVVEELPVSLRGNYLTPGPQTRRQFLHIIDGEHAEPLATEQSGRLELAKWIARPNHPLTARVLVNRVWRWRFGAGIVRTPDNFGNLGDRPTHPDLLDWLAVKFVQDGWSIKKLHKRMMLTATYQMSSRFDELASGVDPENKLWWRYPRKRLEAEAIRDAILRVSSHLDLTMGGSMMPLKDQSYVTGTASKTQEYDNPRRSVYQPVYRSAVYDVMTAFDFPDPATPNGDRHSSVIAPQALLLMNSDLVATSALRIAKELVDKVAEDEDRIDDLYQRTLSRSPTHEEQAAILLHLDQAGASDSSGTDGELQAWQGICRTIIASNEFLYLD